MSIDKSYIDLVKNISQKGDYKKTRNGGTVSLFGEMIKHNMSEGFPLLTTKKMAFKAMATELIWFLRGDTNIRYLVLNNCNIWNGDCYKHYVKEMNKHNEDYKTDSTILSIEDFIQKIKEDKYFADGWGEMGPIYGSQWRNFANEVDQIRDLIKELQDNPDSRRMIVTAWNPSKIMDMVLPPCHYGFLVNTRELKFHERYDLLAKVAIGLNINKENLDNEFAEYDIPSRGISLMWTQRSVDVGLGLPFNISSYALLLQLLSSVLNMVPDKLVGALGDTHLYNNHLEPIEAQLDREPYPLPRVEFSDWLKNSIAEKHFQDDLSEWFRSIEPKDFILKDYVSHPKIELPLSN